MKIVLQKVEVNIAADRVNAHEIFAAVSQTGREFAAKLGREVVQQYQDKILEILCHRSGRVAKKGHGQHEIKGKPGRLCRCRMFRRARYWGEMRQLRGKLSSFQFRPWLVDCTLCGECFAPVPAALELVPHQTCSNQLMRKVLEAVAETGCRCGSGHLDVLVKVPVPKATAHRWAAEIQLPVSESSGKPFLGADGTGFKRQPGQQRCA